MRRATAKERAEFTSKLLKLVPTATEAHAAKLLRWGATYGRLQEAQCNGDWPASIGFISQEWQCPKCSNSWRIPSAKRECPDCRAERIIRVTCEEMAGSGTPFEVVADFQGDPRGFTVRLQIAGAPLDAYERPALAVPTS